MPVLETYKVSFKVEAGKVTQAFAKAEEQGKNAAKTLKNAADESVSAASQMSFSFTSMITKVIALAVAGKFLGFIKNVMDTNLRLRNMTFATTGSMKSLKALENTFKMYSVSAQEADNGFDAFQQSVADLKYNGELNGPVAAFNNLGVAVTDAKGNTRDYYDLLVEAGEKAKERAHGDQQKAAEYLRSVGFSSNQAMMMTQNNARGLKETMTKEAAASVSTAESYQRLNEKMNIANEKFNKMLLEFAERTKVFEALIFLLESISGWCSGKPAGAVDAFFTAMDGILKAIKAVGVMLVNAGGLVKDYVLQPVVKAFDLIGEAVSTISGQKYESKEKWFGDGKPVMTYDMMSDNSSIINHSDFQGGYGGSASGDFDYQSLGDNSVVDTANIPDKIKTIAKQIAQDTGIPAEFVATHLGFESGWGKSKLAVSVHNYGGVTAEKGEPYVQGSHKWRKFSSDYDFTKWYGSYLLRMFPRLRNVRSAQEYLYAIHHGKGGADYAPTRDGNNGYDTNFTRILASKFGNRRSGTSSRMPSTSAPQPTQVASASANMRVAEQSSKAINSAPKIKRRTTNTKNRTDTNTNTELTFMDGMESTNSMLSGLYYS